MEKSRNKKSPSPVKTYNEQMEWAAKEAENPKWVSPEGSGNIFVVNRRGRWSPLEKVGIGAVVVVSAAGLGALGVLGYGAYKDAQAAKPVCESLAEEDVPARDALGTLRVDSAMTLPSANDPNVAVANVFHYTLKSETETKSFARSCALVIEVETVVDEEKLSQTTTDASSLAITELFKLLNKGQTDTKLPAEIRRVSYEVCQNELHVLANFVSLNAEAFENKSMPASFLGDISAPKQRIDYAPYTDVAVPDQNFREIIFTDNAGGVLSCSEPS